MAKILDVRTAVVRDNDGDYQKHCVDNYNELLGTNAGVFADKSNSRSTFEICLYEDNRKACDELFGKGRRTLSALDWMLDNKAEAALALLEKHKAELKVPAYLVDAMVWARQ